MINNIFLLSKVRKIIKHRSPMQIEKSQPSGKRITSVNLVSGIVRLPSGWDFSVSESETDERFCLSPGSIGKYSIYKIVYLKEIQNTKKGKNYFLKAQFNTDSAIDCSGPEVTKLFFMLNSTKHEIFPADKS